jgi:ABC-2 type transport system ATP-binding protein
VEQFTTIGGVRLVRADGRVLTFSCPESALDALVKQVAQHQLVDFVSQPADLEEIFLELYRQDDDGA